MGAPRVTGIVLDRERRMLYRFQDMVDAERAMGGVSFVQALRDQSFTSLSVILWAGLKHEDADLTIQKTVSLLGMAVQQGANFAELWNTVAKALTNSGILRSPDEPSDNGRPS